MKTSDLSPRFYAASSYRYLFGGKKAGKIGSVKNQYVYRCLYFTEGSVEVLTSGEMHTCEAGDLLFLVPGEEYSFIASESFSLINLFFDMVDDSVERDRNVTSCVFKEDFDPSLCSAKPSLSDGAVLKHNRVFKKVSGAHIFTELLAVNRDDVYFRLFAKMSLLQMLYNMLTDEQRRRNVQAQRIISYINLNATEDLSAPTLEQKFGYHRNHINRLVKQETGRTLSECIRRSKINYAKALIAEARIPHAEIAAELGYYDYSHFYKAFVSETGKAPSEIA